MMSTDWPVFPSFAGILLPAVFLVFLLFGGAGTGMAGEPSRNEDVVRLREIETWQRLTDVARTRYTHWFAYAEAIENERCSAVVGLFNVAAKCEQVLLYHLNQRLEALGGRQQPPVRPEYIPCYTGYSAIAVAMQMCSSPADLSTPGEFASPDTGLAEARRAASITPMMLGWLKGKLRLLKSKPADLNWWSREYFVCSLCGMPMDDLRLKVCPACGAQETEFLRVR